jgi:23S rRNA (pseudouridine1915-N3)-methyltransferase
VHVIAVGKLRSEPEAMLLARYSARLRPKLTMTEIPDGRGAPAEVRRREGEAMLEALPASAFAVALDQGGESPGSEVLARLVERWLTRGQPICFLIGGAEGLDPAVLARADATLSLGPLTWPHLLVRPLLAEQLYRAQCIRTGHPYHRAWRPG